jgi:uncharacterized membrane protein HdeD (DUF308 family)
MSSYLILLIILLAATFIACTLVAVRLRGKPETAAQVVSALLTFMAAVCTVLADVIAGAN